MRCPRSSSAISSTPTSITFAADRIEACASAVQASRQPDAGLLPRLTSAASRAVTSADRFPIVPPETKQPAASVVPAEQVGDPAQCLVLGEDRARTRLPQAAEDVGRARHQVERDGCPGGCRRHVGQVQRIVLGARRRLEHLIEDAQRLRAADPGRRDCLAGGGGQLRHRAGRRLRITRPRDPARCPLHRLPDDVGLVAPDLVPAVFRVRCHDAEHARSATATQPRPSRERMTG